MSPTGSPGRSDLDWLLDLLWPNAVTTGSPAGHRYGVINRGGRPRLIIPLDSRRAAAAAATRLSSDVGAKGRALRHAAGFGLRSGVAQPFLRRRWTSVAGSPPSLETYLAAALGIDDICLAVTVGPPRPNRKPVIEILRPTGRTLAFAKVGWNGLTRHLVAREAAVLNGLDRALLSEIVAPRVLHHGTWNDLDVVVLSPLNTPPGTTVAREPSTGELEQTAALHPRSDHPLGSSPYLPVVRDRVDRRDNDDAGLLNAALEKATAELGSDPVAFAGWHGDWTPWNMMATRNELLVWDWERATGPVPLGLDAIHYHFQTAWLRERTPAPDAFTAALSRSRGSVTGLGVRADQIQPLGVLYLVELFLRYAENADHGTEELRRGRHETIAATLRELVADE